MNILLDTHTLIWFALDDPQLSRQAHALIIDPRNVKYATPVNWWEIAIKMSVKKYTLHVPHEVFFEGAVADNGFQVLPITPKHSAA